MAAGLVLVADAVGVQDLSAASRRLRGHHGVVVLEGALCRLRKRIGKVGLHELKSEDGTLEGDARRQS
jgi:hypothetical protein